MIILAKLKSLGLHWHHYNKFRTNLVIFPPITPLDPHNSECTLACDVALMEMCNTILREENVTYFLLSIIFFYYVG